MRPKMGFECSTVSDKNLCIAVNCYSSILVNSSYGFVVIRDPTHLDSLRKMYHFFKKMYKCLISWICICTPLEIRKLWYVLG